MKPPSLGRYLVFAACVLLTLGSLPFLAHRPWLWPLTSGAGLLSVIGVVDLLQTTHAVRRNYPVIGNLRYLIEAVRPALRQYLFEGEEQGVPFNRAQRSLVYTRAKNRYAGIVPFGTLLDVYREGYEFIGHSIRPAVPGDPDTFRVQVGGPQCRQPYSASIFNISAMSFGSLSANAIRALNKGAKLGNFAHDTGEGGISAYHREFGGDLIWEIGSAYFGCRDEAGNFSRERFAAQAREPQVKMIEIKMSQGAKPGHGGILPKAKISAEIAAVRGIPMDRDCISPPQHSAFSTPREMMRFIAELRELSGGKPVGFKLCIGHPWEFMSIVRAMLETGILPDFIVVDGKEGGTGAGMLEFTDHVGVAMREGLLFVHNTLVGTHLRDRIRLGAAGKIVSAFDIASVMAQGADWVNSGRAFMFAVGCIQALSCHTNRCPVGVATQDPTRQRALVVPEKAERVFNYHRNTLLALSEMLAAAGLSSPHQIGPHHVACRLSPTDIRLYAKKNVYLRPGELLSGDIDSDFYSRMWRMSSADSFDPQQI